MYKDYYAFELVSNFAKENKIPFINTLNDFLNREEKKKCFYDYDGHMTPEGYKIVAGGIYDSSVFKGVLKNYMPYVILK